MQIKPISQREKDAFRSVTRVEMVIRRMLKEGYPREQREMMEAKRYARSMRAWDISIEEEGRE